MKRKRLFTVAALIAGLAAALLPVPVVVSVLSPHPRINREVFDRIEIGMTRREVEVLLGAPPGDYTTGLTFADGASVGAIPFRPDPELVMWLGDDGVIEVHWPGGRVHWKTFSEAEKIKQSGFESLCWHYRNGWRMLTGL